MIKKILLFLFLIMLVLGGRSQSLFHHPEAWVIPAPGPEKYFADSVKLNNIKQSSLPRIKYSLNLGTSFSTGGFYGNSFRTWIAPEVNYRVSNKLDLRLGVVASNIYMNNLSGNFLNGEGINNSGSWNSFMIYAGGNYFVNEKLTISATVMKNIDKTPQWVRYSPYYDQNYENLSLSFYYRISNSFHVGADFRISRGNNPYMYYPGTPFGYQPYRFYPGRF